MVKFLQFLILFYSTAQAAWQVDCSNHCFFNDIQPNCQGVFWLYPDGRKGYSAWNSTQNGCFESDLYTLTSHLISLSQINCNCPTPTNMAPANKSAPLTSETRTKLELLRAQVQSWVPCGPDQAGSYSDVFNPFTFRETGNCQQWRKRNLPRTYIVANGCYTGLLPFSDSWYSCAFNGDHLSNTPALCLSKDADGCAQIKDAQNPITGSWYRNGYMRRNPIVTGGQPSFSRDQMMGMLSYWVSSKDKISALKWLNFVKNNGRAPWAGLQMYNLCPPRPNVPKPVQLTDEQWDGQLPDDRCAIIPEAWGLIHVAALSAGVTISELQALGQEMYGLLVTGRTAMDLSLPVTAAGVPALGTQAFQIGNAFDALNIVISSGNTQPIFREAAKTINRRTSYINPLFHFLAEGRATEYGAYLIRKYCPAFKPNWGFWFRSGYSGHPDNSTGYWLLGRNYIYSNYQYAGGVGYYGEPNVPTGFDCLAFLNQYLGNAQMTELACDGNDILINSACLKSSLVRPTLAPIFGIDYKFNPTNLKINYMAFDQTRCPYGGSLIVGSNPVRCEFDSGVTTTLNPNLNYIVDPDLTLPGIYYSTSNSTCQFGGSLVGNRCLIRAMTKAQLLPQVSYWVDPNPANPGVFYARVNGQCPHGGFNTGVNCRVHSFPQGFLDPSKAYFPRTNYHSPGVYYHPRVVPESKVILGVNPGRRAEEVRYLGVTISPGTVIPQPVQKNVGRND